MTTPTPPATQTNKKAWVATIGGLIISLLPVILQLLGHLPPPWGAVFTTIGVALAAITGKATHQVSNVPSGMPPGTVLEPVPPPPPVMPPASGDPWK